MVGFEGGWEYTRIQVPRNDLKIPALKHIVSSAYKFNNRAIPQYHQMKLWYREKGRTFTTGKREFSGDEDARCLLETVDRNNCVELFCTIDPNARKPPVYKQTKPLNGPLTQAASPTTKNPPTSNIKPKPVKLEPRANTSARDNSAVVITRREWSAAERERVASEQSVEQQKAEKGGVSKGKGHEVSGEGEGVVRRSPRVKTVAVKGKGKQPTGKKKTRASKKLFSSELSGSGSDSSDSDFTDLDIDWEPGEEETILNDADDFEELLRKTK